MKVIQTRYKGYKFRSRLEARWAVFFDSLGIEWEYEKEGYHFNDGTNYLPDFWLPQVKMWAEIKGKEFMEEDFKKIENLVYESNFPVLMLIGIPELKAYNALCVGEDKKFFGCEFVLSNYHNYPKEEGRFYSSPGESEEEFEVFFKDTKEATIRAKEARFEFKDK